MLHLLQVQINNLCAKFQIICSNYIFRIMILIVKKYAKLNSFSLKLVPEQHKNMIFNLFPSIFFLNYLCISFCFRKPPVDLCMKLKFYFQALDLSKVPLKKRAQQYTHVYSMIEKHDIMYTNLFYNIYYHLFFLPCKRKIK